MSGLVGDSHQAALRTLIDAYERVDAKVAAEASGPADSELVVLSAPMGWGKTRVVQEFYAHLAAEQPSGTPYWPSELVADVDRGPALKARKRVEPGTFEVSNSTNMPFLWWGVSCQERQDDRLSNAVADDIGQLVAHFRPALNKLEANRATRHAALGLARTLMAAAPFSDVPGILDGLDNFRTNIRDLFRAQRDRQRGATRRIDPSENDGSLIETWVGAIGSLLRTARIPMVVILDDAHWADPSSIEFIDELLKRVPCLAVLTAWPDQLTIQERNDQPGDAGSLTGHWLDRLTVCHIERPRYAAAVGLAASALGVEISHPLAAQLAERAHGNPLVLRLWTELPNVQSAALAGTTLEPEDLAELPKDAQAEFQRRWRDLPKAVQTVLAPAAQYGTNFARAVVAETLEAVDIIDPSASDRAFLDATDPHWWTRRLTVDTDQFTEPLLQEIAEDQVREVLTARQQRDLNAAFVDCLGRLRSSNDWAELTTACRRVLLGHHVRLTKSDEAGEPAGIVATYKELADLQPESLTGWTKSLEHITTALSLTNRTSPDNPGVLLLRNRKINLLQALGRCGEALPLCQQIVTDRERVLGLDHPDTLTSRNNLAHCLIAVGRAMEALPIYERSLTDYERILGADHPDTLWSRGSLAYGIEVVGRSGDALALYRQTLTDRERVLGLDHPDTLTSRNNLASCLRGMGRANEALPIHKQTLADRERTQGAGHPDTLSSRHNLAYSLEAVGRSGDALPLYTQNLTDQERFLGADHPDTLTSRNNLANCLITMGRANEALPIHKQNLIDRERTLGAGHPDTLQSRNNLAHCLITAGRADEALPIYERNPSDTERILGPNHPDTLQSRNNLAHCLQAVGRSDEALPIYEPTLIDQERILGPDHPSTVITRDNLANCLDALNRPEDAARVRAGRAL